MTIRPIRPSRRTGAALLLTITVVALMTVIVVDRLYEAWVQSALAAGFRDDTRALFRARSGLEAARLILVEDARANVPHDALTEEWAQSTIPIPMDDDFVFLSIRDESGKLDLNAMTSPQGYPQERFVEIFKRLLRHLELDSRLADAAVDWIDPNIEPEAGGAEEGYYRSLDIPYGAKNAKFDSVEELALVKGFTPEATRLLTPFVTVWSSGKINLNTAPPEVLLALDDRMTKPLVTRILRERIEKPFADRIDVKRVPGMEDIYPDIALAVDVKSDIYRIESSATVGETTKIITAILRRGTGGVETLYYRML
jgi:general secretion pathway protein K